MSEIGTGRPGDDELDRDPALRGAVDELHRYAGLVEGTPPPGFTDTVMAAVDAAPPPRAGLPGWFAARLAALGAPARQSLRLVALTAVIVLAVGGALAGAGLSGLLRNGPSAGSSSLPTASPVVTATPSPSASPEPTESSTLEPTESPSPTTTGGGAEPTSSTRETETPSTHSPEPSASEGQGATPQPSETPESSASPGGGGDG